MSYGASWGVWWGLGLEVPAWASLPPAVIRDQEQRGELPAGSAAQLGGVIVSKRLRGTLRPELVITSGPQRLAQTGGGTFVELYGARWALGVYRGGPRLYQARSGVWVDRTDPAALGALTARGVRHAALAFDQAARPVIAWEVAGQVYVRQWDALAAQYVTRGPWAGCDPLLISDALMTRTTADSDVVLYHLTADRAQIMTRVQRDVYGVARPVADVPAATVLDQVTALPYRWQLLGEAAAGRVVLRSDLYPIPSAHSMTGGAVLTGGDMFLQLISRPVGHGMTGGAVLTSGDMYAQLDTRTAGDAMTGGAVLTGGDVYAQLISRTAGDAVTGAAALTGGTSATILISRTAGDGMTGACVLTGGTYA